jgi:metal-dependent amidase/aminoacylase/carboxypeptidase family protein
MAHAGAAPHLGINALKAATLGLTAIDALRDTFRDEDAIRVHPIITKGGDVVNAVPSDVHVETIVRGKRLEAIEETNAKVDRALRAGALAMGALVRITTMPGYLPLANDPTLTAIFRENAVALVGADEVAQEGHRGSTTDAGDLSQIMPIVHPLAGGAVGATHTTEFLVADLDLGVLNPAKTMAMTAIDLLCDGASRGGQLLADYRAPLSKREYLEFMRRMAYELEYDGSGPLGNGAAGR